MTSTTALNRSLDCETKAAEFAVDACAARLLGDYSAGDKLDRAAAFARRNARAFRRLAGY